MKNEKIFASGYTEYKKISTLRPGLRKTTAGSGNSRRHSSMSNTPRIKGQVCARCRRELYDHAPLVDHLLVEWNDGIVRVEAIYCADCAKAMADAIEALRTRCRVTMKWYQCADGRKTA